ncbi:ABC transporter permease [Ensifer adhaerens]|uniref:ABC transporter permease n=1 Tax=Ensifer adhaerens TaxID=106592 RepID=UPI001CC07210|nr:ABC transporter permease [Ensifer adhaerens]UAX96524.1 ABC transporter permease [Ensifer adhaerens]UAY04132.1 ABC transporter permease [Ensifer adhaerens]UAY12118.1 ABC transporter permease [Ensifer adhaerens]
MLQNVQGASWRLRRLASGRAAGALVVLLILIPLFSTVTEHFLTYQNVINIGLQSSILLIVALPVTLVILTEGLDLSPGSVVSLCSVVLALLLVSGYSLGVASVLAICVGFLFGCANGFLIAGLGMPPFVVTLGVSGIAYGIALVVTGGNAVSNLGEELSAFSSFEIAGVPLLIYVALGSYLAVHTVLYWTPFGRYVFAVGGNSHALRLAGVNVFRVHVAVYAVLGAACGLAALCLIGRTNAAHPSIALGTEFDAIAAVVLGGTTFERGNGSLPGTVLGVIVIGVLRNGLNLLAIDTSVQVIAIGALVLIVQIFDRFFRNEGEQ